MSVQSTKPCCPHCVLLKGRCADEGIHSAWCDEPGCAASDPSQKVLFEALLARQEEWSMETFGMGRRTLGLIGHIESELKEIAENPTDVTEWVDVMILAMDGAWRTGASPQEIVEALVTKQTKNAARSWPDPATLSQDQPAFHTKVSEED